MYAANFHFCKNLFVFQGQGYQQLIVTFNRMVLIELPQERALEAHLIQFGSLYVFGRSYQTDEYDRLLPENIRNFFDFCTIFLWNIRIKYLRGGSKTPKIKPIPKKLNNLIKEISMVELQL